jgi:TRAP-type C4-dicarboxylate transport system permease small subunit
MLRLLDRLNDLLAFVAAWLFFATAAMITWEVVARYVFTAPTIWAEELSRVFLVWGTFLAMAALLRRRSHIRITIVTNLMRPGGRRAAEVFSLLVIAATAGVAAWYGWTIALDSFLRDRTTATMLNLPQVWVEISVPLGFLLLGLQALVETWRLLRGDPLPHDAAEQH